MRTHFSSTGALLCHVGGVIANQSLSVCVWYTNG